MAVIDNVQKLTQEELDQLVSYRDRLNDATYQRGQIGVAEDNLNAQKGDLIKTFIELYKEEKEISDALTEKYGQGEIDLENGTIAVSPQED